MFVDITMKNISAQQSDSLPATVVFPQRDTVTLPLYDALQWHGVLAQPG
jgi:hypothetical protein